MYAVYSYMAVTGVPDETDKHAEIMAEFALDMIRGFSKVVSQKMVEGKKDVADLKVRVGFHTGSVIGGVVRGDKGRFQLFGDTVNTASRMESTGVPGQIQCSESSWRKISKAGVDRIVLTERFPKIEAKGKGTMTTYFVTPKGDMNDGTMTPRPGDSQSNVLTPRYETPSKQFPTGTAFPSCDIRAKSDDTEFGSSSSPRSRKPKKHVSWIAESVVEVDTSNQAESKSNIDDITGKVMLESVDEDEENGDPLVRAADSADDVLARPALTKTYSDFIPAIHDVRPSYSRKWDFLRQDSAGKDKKGCEVQVTDYGRSSSDESAEEFNFARLRAGTTGSAFGEPYDVEDDEDNDEETDGQRQESNDPYNGFGFEGKESFSYEQNP